MTIDLIEGEKASVVHTDCTTYTVETELIIDAPAEKVWAVLTDFDKIEEWSPGLIKFEGEFRKDGPAKVTFLIGIGDHTQVFDHPLVHFEEGRMFGWSAPLPLVHMTDNHKYIIDPLEGDSTKCKILHSDEFHGSGAHLVGGMMANGMMTAYVNFNRALKKRVEEM